MNTAVVVGGTGFLGRHVVAALQAAGWSVRSLSRRTGFNALNPDPESFRGADVVVNLAGIKRPEGDQTFESVHVELVRNLVAAMKAAEVRRLVHISVVVARPAPELPYHDTKWRGEEIVRTSGLDYIILRPGVIYGVGDDMLSHLALMIRTAPYFPIVGRGTSPMRPVDARDVAAAVVAAASAATAPSSGKTYDIVGPQRMELRDVVRTVAEALNLQTRIIPTPVMFMRVAAGVMETVMAKPLSTRAQVAMLIEGLDGDPGPARQDLNLSTAPFTAARIRPLLTKATRSTTEITAVPFWTLLLIAFAGLSIAFGVSGSPWLAMTVVMTIALAGTLFLPAVRRGFRPTAFGIVAGLVAGLVLFGITQLAIFLIPSVWPGWEAYAREIYAWKAGHSVLFLATTLVLIVIAEEALWRGVVTSYTMERFGRLPGIVLGAGIFAIAHWAAFNPLLLLAAVGCGLFWNLLYAATDDLTIPTVSHLLWDFLLLFLFPAVP
jgi:uncharacterized protein YbjT (DUF2867 family)/membrane protease YdiL (CAAX protease family)